MIFEPGTNTTFLGKPIDYWLALDARAEELNVARVFEELVSANALLRYYEGHFDDILRYRETVRRVIK